MSIKELILPENVGVLGSVICCRRLPQERDERQWDQTSS
jgi:hypothetical protein